MKRTKLENDKHRQVWLLERWDEREINDRVYDVCPDVYQSMSHDWKFVLMIPNPSFANMN